MESFHPVKRTNQSHSIEKVHLAVLYGLKVRVTGQVSKRERRAKQKGWHVKWKDKEESEILRRENLQSLSFGINVAGEGKGEKGEMVGGKELG